jgi:outer membrane protein TolC
MIRLAVLAGLLPLAAVRAQDRPLALEEAVQLALKQNETVLIAEQGVEKARGQISSARSEALPKLALNGFYTRNWRVPTNVINGNAFRFGSTNVLNGNITLSIPLYKGGKVQAARRAAQAFRAYAEANLTTARQQVVFDTQRAFYGVLLAEELVKVNESALQQAEAHLEQVSRLHQAGTASDYEVLRARVQAANLKPGAITARNNRDLALLDLKRTIGMDLAAPLTVAGALNEAAAAELPAANRVEEAVQTALRNRQELAALDYQLDMLEDGVRVQAGELRPSVSLVNSYQNQAQVNDLNDLNKDRFVQSYNSRLVIDVPVFDGFKSRGGVVQARADLRSAAYSREQRIKQIELEARQAFMRVEEARMRLWAQQETVGQAEKGLEIAGVRYRTGVATQLEIIDAQLVLTQARTSHAQALNDYAVAVAGLRRAVGAVK